MSWESFVKYGFDALEAEVNVARALAPRYASDPEFKRTVDAALGVFHIPRHSEGQCAGCDAQREREASNQESKP